MTQLRRRAEELHSSMKVTPVVKLPDRKLNLYAKLEFSNPNGSTKDRSAFWILQQAIERGDVTEDTTIVESSSGNFAIAMAAFSHALGLAFIPVIDRNCNAPTEDYLRAMCTRVEKITEPDESGGYLGGRLARVRQIRDELPRAYWPNQYENGDSVAAYYRLTGDELCRALDRIDYVFVGVSTGGTIAGLSLRVKEAFPFATVVAVDSEGSAIFGGPAQQRRIPGLGSSIVPPLCSRAQIDDVVIVPERDAVAGCHELHQRYGLYAGGSTGSVYAAIRRYFGAHPVGETRPTVVFLCADRGTAYADTIYNAAWVDEYLPIDDGQVSCGVPAATG